MMKKENCWEYSKCGREEGGKMAEWLGVCPASTKTALDGVHGGKNCGRACWVVAGTFCGDSMQGTFSSKIDECSVCSFFQNVMEEEGEACEDAYALWRRLHSGILKKISSR